MPAAPRPTVSDNPDAKRFEAHADGELVGVLEYIPLDGKIVATHTEVTVDEPGSGPLPRSGTPSLPRVVVRAVVTAVLAAPEDLPIGYSFRGP